MPKLTYKKNSTGTPETFFFAAGTTLGDFLSEDAVDYNKVRVFVNGVETTAYDRQLAANDEIVLQARNLSSGKTA